MLRNVVFSSLVTVSVIAGVMLTDNSAISGQHNPLVRTSMNDVVQSQPAGGNQPAMIRNGQPGEMHRRLDALIGRWNVAMTLYIAGGSREKPIIASDLICFREWIAETGNRHLRDITQGTVAGNPYYRLGILSYSTMDKRYEWNTVDALNTNMMTYKGARGSASLRGEIVMSGEFTDQGVLGDAYAGKTIRQKTVIKVESFDRHIFELYFTPPGEKERLVARAVYSREKLSPQ